MPSTTQPERSKPDGRQSVGLVKLRRRFRSRRSPLPAAYPRHLHVRRDRVDHIRPRALAGSTLAGAGHCSRCREWLPLSSYGRDSRGYWRARCDPCARLVTREWHRTHHAQDLARARARYAALRGRGASAAEAAAGRFGSGD